MSVTRTGMFLNIPLSYVSPSIVKKYMVIIQFINCVFVVHSRCFQMAFVIRNINYDKEYRLITLLDIFHQLCGSEMGTMV